MDISEKPRLEYNFTHAQYDIKPGYESQTVPLYLLVERPIHHMIQDEIITLDDL